MQDLNTSLVFLIIFYLNLVLRSFLIVTLWSSRDPNLSYVVFVEFHTNWSTWIYFVALIDELKK